MSEANKALIRLWGEEGFNKNNMAIADKVYAADVFYHEPTAGEVIGLEPLKQFVVTWRTAFPDALCRIDEWVGEGDRLAVRWALWGTHQGDFRGLAPTGRSVEFTACYFYRFDGGKVVEIHAMVNILKILQQLGAVPSLKQVKN
jgi:steroid delta-isomerase-like uncharacterized protein